MTREQVLGSIIISLIAATATWLASRAASKASVKNAVTSSRAVMEEEAYQRARTYDVETIRRQDEEIDELRENQKTLNADVKMVNKENERLHQENSLILQDNYRLRGELLWMRKRIVRLERGLPAAPLGNIQERETDTNPMMPEQVQTDPMMREILENGRNHKDQETQ
jgi:predicted nuclease with TOPRIM domain